LRDFFAANWGDSRGFATIWHRPKAGKENPINASEWFKYPEQFDALVKYAESLTDKDVYTSPSLYSKATRTPLTASYTNTVWCDADPAAPENFRLQPSRIVVTRTGRWQLYWDLAEQVSTAQASLAARKIAVAHKDVGADPSSWPKNKLMRVPGSTNTNGDKHETVTVENTGAMYLLDDILGAYEDIEVASVEASPTLQTRDVAGVPKPEDLPDYVALIGRIPETQTRLYELITKVPKTGAEGWQSEQRWGLILDLFRFGFTSEEVTSVVWSAPVAVKWRQDQRGIEGLWSEVQKASNVFKQELVKATGEGIEPPEKRKVGPIVKLRLISDEARARVENTPSLDRMYLEYARSKVKAMNRPLHESNVWVYLSTAYADIGYAAKKGSRMPLNLYVIEIAESSSGKSEAYDLMEMCINALYPNDLPWIGANHSENALTEKLMAREGKVSIVHIEEAHGRLKQMKQNGWNTGLEQTWTAIYDGKLAVAERTGKETILKQARPIMSMHMIGTPNGMFTALDREMFLSGYLARQLWAVGETIETTDDVYRVDESDAEDIDKEYEAMPKYWASQVAQNKLDLVSDLPLGRTRRPMRMTEEAQEMAFRMNMKMDKHLNAQGDPEIFVTVGRRIQDSFRKIAILAAMSDNSKWVTTQHIERAAYYMEKFADTVIYVAGKVSDTIFSRNLDEIETWLAGRPEMEAPASKIFQFRSGDAKRFTQEYLDNLIAQGRVSSRMSKTNGETWYAIKRRAED
jgi:hypothetical protein